MGLQMERSDECAEKIWSILTIEGRLSYSVVLLLECEDDLVSDICILRVRNLRSAKSDDQVERYTYNKLRVVSNCTSRSADSDGDLGCADFSRDDCERDEGE